MPLVLHDYLGVGHDLSKGAFDSISISKPGGASKLLAQYLPKEFDQGWKDLAVNYKTALKSYQPSMWKKMWNMFGAKGIKQALQAGAAKYAVGRPLIHKWIAGIAASDPTIGAVVAAAEVGLAKVLDTWGDQAGTKTIRAKKGQWVFIETIDSFNRRRRMGKVDPKVPPNEKQPPKTKTVGLGFFIEPMDKNRVNVFSLDLGRPQNIEISQMLECDPSVAQRLDQDERLSTLRELFFYKYDGSANTKGKILTKPYYAGRHVRYKGQTYILLYEKGGKCLLEDGNGKTIVVNVDDIGRDFGESTPGEYDDGFQPAGKNNLYIGQWVFCPARDDIMARYDSEIELGVLNKIAPDNQCVVYYAFDGKLVYVDDEVIKPLNKHFQELYNAKKLFTLFRWSAIKGTKSTERFALGQDFAHICVGRDYTDALTTETPYISKEKYENIVFGEKDPGPDTGNTRKEALKAKNELREKGLKSFDKIENVEYAETDDGVTGTVIVGLALAAMAYALFSAA